MCSGGGGGGSVAARDVNVLPPVLVERPRGGRCSGEELSDSSFLRSANSAPTSSSIAHTWLRRAARVAGGLRAEQSAELVRDRESQAG